MTATKPYPELNTCGVLTGFDYLISQSSGSPSMIINSGWGSKEKRDFNSSYFFGSLILILLRK
jgi:hypothetical protein